jgi:acetyltransferase EpsM
MGEALKLVIWGSGGHARVVADIVHQVGKYAIQGFLDDLHRERHGTAMSGATILGGREQLVTLRAAGVGHLIVAIGDCSARVHLADAAVRAGFALARAIHPRAVVAEDCAIGAGSVIAAGAILNPGTTCGESVIINTAASVDHDNRIGDAAHIGPGACLGGYVTVGRAAWIGIGAVLRDRVSVGDGSIVGAGSVVVRDIPAGVVAYGVPARVVRPVEPA